MTKTSCRETWKHCQISKLLLINKKTKKKLGVINKSLLFIKTIAEIGVFKR